MIISDKLGAVGPSSGPPATFPFTIDTSTTAPVLDCRDADSITFGCALLANVDAGLLSALIYYYDNGYWWPVNAEEIAGATGIAPQVPYNPTRVVAAVAEELFVVRVPAIGERMKCVFTADVAPGTGSSVESFARRD